MAASSPRLGGPTVEHPDGGLPALSSLSATAAEKGKPPGPHCLRRPVHLILKIALSPPNCGAEV